MLSEISHCKILGFGSYFLHLERSKISHGASKAGLLKAFNKRIPLFPKLKLGTSSMQTPVRLWKSYPHRIKLPIFWHMDLAFCKCEVCCCSRCHCCFALSEALQNPMVKLCHHHLVADTKTTLMTGWGDEGLCRVWWPLENHNSVRAFQILWP